MKNILNSPKLNAWAVTEPDYCRECSRKEKCLYGCKAASQQLGYDLKKEDPIVNIYGANRFEKELDK